MTLPGSKIMLLGATGTGKTYALQTFIDAGVTPFILSTEPGIESTLGHIPPEKLHWRYIAPTTQSWDQLIDSAKKINMYSFESLSKMSDINKREYTQFIEAMQTCNNFVCDRTGESFGDIATWGPDRAFIIDSLSGLNVMAMNLVVGSKPTKNPGDWGVAMDNLERFLTTLTTGLNCYFVLTGHVERERDEVTGGVQLMVGTLGQKLAPKLPRFFDEVVLARREGTNFFWSTATTGIDLKARNLPISEKLPPDFASIVKTRSALSHD